MIFVDKLFFFSHESLKVLTSNSIKDADNRNIRIISSLQDINQNVEILNHFLLCAL